MRCPVAIFRMNMANKIILDIKFAVFWPMNDTNINFAIANIKLFYATRRILKTEVSVTNNRIIRFDP
jgi:hypothetical protein